MLIGNVIKRCNKCTEKLLPASVRMKEVEWVCSGCGSRTIEDKTSLKKYIEIPKTEKQRQALAQLINKTEESVVHNESIALYETVLRKAFIALFTRIKTGTPLQKAQQNVTGSRRCPVCGSRLLVFDPGNNSRGYTTLFVCSNGFDEDSKIPWCGFYTLGTELSNELLTEVRNNTPGCKIIHDLPRCPDCSGTLILHPIYNNSVYKSRWFCTTGNIDDDSFCGYERLNIYHVGDILSFIE